MLTAKIDIFLPELFEEAVDACENEVRQLNRT